MTEAEFQEEKLKIEETLGMTVVLSRAQAMLFRNILRTLDEHQETGLTPAQVRRLAKYGSLE